MTQSTSMPSSEAAAVEAAEQLEDASSRPAGLEPQPQALHPVRGVVPLRNWKGQPYALIDLLRWIRLNCSSFKAEKVDLHAEGEFPPFLEKMVLQVHDPDLGFGLTLSLRTDCTIPPDRLDALAARHLYDVALCPVDIQGGYFNEWLAACERLELPVRVELTPPFPEDLEALAERLTSPMVNVIDLTVTPMFRTPAPLTGGKRAEETVRQINDLAKQLAEGDAEVNIVGLPLCHVDSEHLIRAYNSQQLYLDHQHYIKRACEFADIAYRRRPWLVSKLVQITLGRDTSRRTLIDGYILGWLVSERPLWHSGVSIVRRLTRHLRFMALTPKPVEETEEAYRAEVERIAHEQEKAWGPECSQCAYRRICDNCPQPVRKALPGLALHHIPGEMVVSPRAFVRDQPKYFDSLDETRRHLPEIYEQLAGEAKTIVTNELPDRVPSFSEWHLDNSFYIKMPGALQWFSIVNQEIISSVIAWMDAPYTVAVTFGDGIADQIGFGIGDHTRIMCPMEAYTHQLVLHVDKEGRYVLLRDGVRVDPTRFEDRATLPSKAPTTAPLRLVAHNIDRYIFTQNLMIWEGERKAVETRAAVKYSVIIVSTRFCRRLQAVLRSLAHQSNYDMSQVEIVVAYVPGLDATDDLLTSFELTYPDLRIVRAPFQERNAKAKGLMINEASRLVAGEWTILLDSDILVPPNIFELLDEHAHNVPYVAPEGRKMLTPQTTAKILMGEIEPWNEWQALLDSPGTLRGKESGYLPIGFFQCAQTKLLRELGYREFDHFQGADWEFIVNMYAEYGPGRWLSGIHVCHLDHGGSQWFGAKRQM